MSRSTRRISAFFIMLLMVDAACAAGQDVATTLAKLAPGRRVEVVLNGGEKWIGRLGPLESDRFVLAPDKRSGTQRVVRFDEVRTVKTKLTVGKKWAIAGGVYAVLVVFGLILGG